MSAADSITYGTPALDHIGPRMQNNYRCFAFTGDKISFSFPHPHFRRAPPIARISRGGDTHGQCNIPIQPTLIRPQLRNSI